MADWLGAMFQGIGDTFKAGAAVDQAKITQETLRQQNDYNLDALDVAKNQFRASAILETNNAQRNMILVVMAIITIVIIVYILKST